MHDRQETIGHHCVEFEFNGRPARARASGALHLPGLDALVVADLHLGKSERFARKGSGLLPPYETSDTLRRLADDLRQSDAGIVICLGDSFDDNLSAAHVGGAFRGQLTELQQRCRWIWVCGNHDPDPEISGGELKPEFSLAGLIFCHVATARRPEISGHYHPKARISARGRQVSRACFLADRDRIILPAYGTYTGGLDCRRPPLSKIMRDDAIAILTGRYARKVFMPTSQTG